MQNKEIFVIILLILLIILCLFKFLESFVNCGIPSNDDITPKITVDSTYNDSTISTFSYFPNNLVGPPSDIQQQLDDLSKFQPDYDGSIPDITEDNEDKEEFTQMNPIIFNH